MYGVIAYGVAQRTREMGVRMALGANNRRILRLVLGEGVRLAATGAVLGLIAAFASTRLIRSLLFETVPTDPVTFIVTPLVLQVSHYWRRTFRPAEQRAWIRRWRLGVNESGE